MGERRVAEMGLLVLGSVSKLLEPILESKKRVDWCFDKILNVQPFMII